MTELRRVNRPPNDNSLPFQTSNLCCILSINVCLSYEKVISNVEISLNILVEGRQVYNEVVWQSYALELDQY
jgi:hypothetical protein